MDQKAMIWQLAMACKTLPKWEGGDPIIAGWNPFLSLDDLRPVLEEIERRGFEVKQQFITYVYQGHPLALNGVGSFDLLLTPTAILATAAHRVLCEGQEGRDA